MKSQCHQEVISTSKVLHYKFGVVEFRSSYQAGECNKSSDFGAFSLKLYMKKATHKIENPNTKGSSQWFGQCVYSVK